MIADMHFSAHLQPNDKFKSYVWRRVLEIAPHIEASATWTLSGTAGAAALVIGNVDSIASKLGNLPLAIIIVLLATSLIVGAISKTIGAALTVGLSNIDNAAKDFDSKQMQSVMSEMTIPAEEMAGQLAQPFWGPISSIVLRQGRGGLNDPLASERKFVGLLCLQLYAYWIHALLTISTLPVAACVLLAG